LSNGGKLRGELNQSDADSVETTVYTLGGARIAVKQDSVRAITRRPLIVEEYEVLAADTPDEVDAQWELSEWCRQNGLRAQREEHLRRIIELDPEHERARRGLGHVRFEGEWTTREAVMEARGYVKHGSRFVTQQERDLLQAKEAAQEVEGNWNKSIRKWHSWLTGRSLELRQEAMGQLRQIRDPAAISSLARVFSEEEDASLRSLYVELLARIPGEAAVQALVRQSLFDPESTPRLQALEALPTDSYALAVPHYIQALKHEQNVIVCRAAAALEAINDPSAVPALIDALVTNHRYRVRIADRSNTYSFGANGSFADPYQSLLPPEIEMQMRTGQLPNGVIVLKPPSPGPQRTRLVTIARDHRNSPVLSALTVLTGEAFGYDKQAWGMWWAGKQQAPPAAKALP
jgi:hypothetical protein